MTVPRQGGYFPRSPRRYRERMSPRLLPLFALVLAVPASAQVASVEVTPDRATLIAGNEGDLWLSNTGNPGMGGGGITPEMMCDPNLFPAPEVDANLTPMNHFNMMSDTMKIESFLKTLSDGYYQK